MSQVSPYAVSATQYAQAPYAPVVSWTPRTAALAGETMGTTWSARLVMPPGLAEPRVQAAIQAALNTVVAQMSTWESDSDLSRFNTAEPGWHVLPSAFYSVLDCALTLARDTQGAFDPTVGPLVNAWGFGPAGRHAAPPNTATLQALSARCGWQRLKLDASTCAAWQAGGTALDLSGIAKGYGVDAACQALDALGITHYLMEVGGELRARGHRADQQPWRIAIEIPDASGDFGLTLPLRDQAIATSGDYRRYRGHAPGQHSHTIDPRTCRPIANGVASLTVIHADCMHADALASALTVLGETAGMAYAEQANIAALFVMRQADDFRPSASSAMQRLLEQSAPC